MLDINFRELLKAILAGICISIGGSVFLSVENTIIGSFLFSIGLFCVCCGGLNLYTGKVCYLQLNSIKNYVFLLIVLLGNLLGTLLFSLLLSYTRNAASLQEKALAICMVKAKDSYLSLFLLGVVCNIFIYIAVNGYKTIEHEVGKYLAIIFGVMGFILCKSEHCVADMFYISMANYWNINMFIRLLVIVFGNAVGGLLAHTLLTKTKEE